MKNQEVKMLKENKHHGSQDFRCCMYRTDPEPERSALEVRHHWHDELELLYFKSGHYRLIINMDSYLIDEECFCFVNKGELHAIHMVEPGEEYALLFDPAIISFQEYDETQARLLQPLEQGELALPHFIRVSDLAFQPVKRVMEAALQLFLEFGEASPESEENGHCRMLTGCSDQLMLKAELLRLIAVLNAYGLLNEKQYEPQKQVKVIKDAVNYIHEHYQSKIYIRDLAELTGLNEQYFIRFFGNTMGKSPVEYINEYRIKKARELLRTTDKAVTVVADNCGFHNMGNFIKIFKDFSGTTPLKYRKQNLS